MELLRKYSTHLLERASTVLDHADCMSYSMPTFLIFQNGRVSSSIRGANAVALSAAVLKIAADLPKEWGICDVIWHQLADGPMNV